MRATMIQLQRRYSHVATPVFAILFVIILLILVRSAKSGSNDLEQTKLEARPTAYSGQLKPGLAPQPEQDPDDDKDDPEPAIPAETPKKEPQPESKQQETVKDNVDPPQAKTEQMKQPVEGGGKGGRKFFLDCGANAGSSYKLFRELWPNSHEFTAILFEIDERMAPCYAGFNNHVAHVPLGVSYKNTTLTATLSEPWLPTQLRGEKRVDSISTLTGNLFNRPKPGLGLVKEVKVLNLVEFMLKHFTQDDYIVFKLDVEGAEYDILKDMLDTGAYKLVDMYYGELHGDKIENGWTSQAKKALEKRLEDINFRMEVWEGHDPMVPNAEKQQPLAFNGNRVAQVVTSCPKLKSKDVIVAVALGMNRYNNERIMGTVLAHTATQNVTIAAFVYRDFLLSFPDLVNKWAQTGRVVLGIRGAKPIREPYIVSTNEATTELLSSLRKARDWTGQVATWYLPDTQQTVSIALVKYHLDIVGDNATVLPPKDITELSKDYSTLWPIRRAYNLLQYSFDKLSEGKTNMIILDADFDEVWQGSRLLLDFLGNPAINSGFQVANWNGCF